MKLTIICRWAYKPTNITGAPSCKFGPLDWCRLRRKESRSPRRAKRPDEWPDVVAWVSIHGGVQVLLWLEHSYTMTKFTTNGWYKPKMGWFILSWTTWKPKNNGFPSDRWPGRPCVFVNPQVFLSATLRSLQRKRNRKRHGVFMAILESWWSTIRVWDTFYFRHSQGFKHILGP